MSLLDRVPLIFSLALTLRMCLSLLAIYFSLDDDDTHCMFLIKIFDAVKQDTVIHFIHVFRGKKQ